MWHGDIPLLLTLGNSYNIIGGNADSAKYYPYRGKVTASVDEKEGIVCEEIDLDYVKKVRTNIPISKQKQLQTYTPAQPKL